MSHALKEVVTLRDGDPQGNGMALRLTTRHGVEIYAMGVPQDWASRTGPTWTYLFDNEGLTLIDAGAAGSFADLADGLGRCGFGVADVERVIITHGHADHDGAAAQLVDEAGAELWAHDIYAQLIEHGPPERSQASDNPFQEEIARVLEADRESRGAADGPSRRSGRDTRGDLEVSRRIRDGDRSGDLGFLHTPGHSPDEICATLDGVVFTGDHVLPEITPHPTTKLRHSVNVKRGFGDEAGEEDAYYGLETYLRSLSRVVELGADTSVLPAHRLFNGGSLNLVGVERAGEIIEHHDTRLRRILHRLRSQETDLEAITRGIFDRRKLMGGNLYMALQEMVSHLELLLDAGDLELTDDRRLRRTGSENYVGLISDLTS